MTTGATTPEDRGWFPDPYSSGSALRFFDGAVWTEKTRPLPDASKAAKTQGAPQVMASTPTAQQASTAPSTPEATSGWQTAPPRPTDDSDTAGPTETTPPRLDSAPRKVAPSAPGTTIPLFARPVAGQAPQVPPTAPQPVHTPPPASPQQLTPDAWSTPAPAPTPGPVEPSATQQPLAAGWGSPSPEQQEEPDVSNAAYDPETSSAGAFQRFPDPADLDDEIEPESGRWRALLSPRLLTWVAVLLLAAAAIIVPRMQSAPYASLPEKVAASECAPLLPVVEQLKAAESTKLTPEWQASLAAIAAEGKLTPDMLELVSAGVNSGDLSQLLATCSATS